MPTQLTADDARLSLSTHVAAKGAEVFEKYGPRPAWKTLLRLLDDRTCVRYPCIIVFDAALLLPGEFAHALPRGEHPEAGFTIYVHPLFMTQLDRVPALVLYQLAQVNYGDFASAHDAEVFGSAALGLEQESYYQQLCEAADQLDGGCLR